jgi:uncharacterized protein (TIGR02996 family)
LRRPIPPRYRMVVSGAIERLEAAILAERDDVELYLVYADELQQRGDPRGELIVMQSQIQATDDRDARKKLQKTCDKWIARHDFLGPLRDFPTFGEGRKADVTWRYGFIRCLEIAWGPSAAETPAEARATLEEILRHPSSPFITYLVLASAPGGEQGLIEAMVATGCPRAVRTLQLGRHSGSLTSTGTVGDASAVLARVQKLTLKASHVRLGRLVLPEVEEIRIECGDLDEDLVVELGDIRCPKLKTLTISFDQACATPEQLEKRLGSRLPHVRKLRARAVQPW